MKQVHRKWKLIIAAAAGVAFLFKITIALTTLGTNDVLTWQEFLRSSRELAGIDLYHRVTPFDGDRPFLFNHPPFMIHVLRLMGLLVTVTGLPFPFWIRMPAILADAGSLWLTWKILSLGSGAPRRPVSLALMAICPASILISGFHGNTDPVM